MTDEKKNDKEKKDKKEDKQEHPIVKIKETTVCCFNEECTCTTEHFYERMQGC